MMEYWAPISGRLVPKRNQWRVYKEHSHWVAALRITRNGEVCVPMSMFPTWRQAYDWARFGWINDC